MAASRTSSFLKSPLGFSLSTALGAGVLATCAFAGSIHPDKLAGGARVALTKGKLDKAVTLAEQAVAADPRNPAWRVVLGDVYLRSGRFVSARQAYDEALKLGDDKGRTALALALSEVALGRYTQAIDTLSGYRDAIPAADYGLALALAGQPAQAVAVLTDVLRAGENTPKVRQNLAYALALSGNWPQAQVMVAMDLPADKVDARIAEWAQAGRPEDTQKRVAMLIGAPLRGDSGEPSALALQDFAPLPSGSKALQASAPANPNPSLVAVSAHGREPAAALAQAAASELPPLPSETTPSMPAVEVATRAPEPAVFRAAPADDRALLDGPAATAVAASAEPAIRMVSRPVVQAVRPAAPRVQIRRPAAPAVMAAAPVPAARPVVAPRLARIAPRPVPAVAQPVQNKPAIVKVTATPAPAPVTLAKGNHSAQLGAYATADGAQRAIGHLAKRNPILGNAQLASVKVNVNGKTYWRVMAMGLAPQSASATCRSVKMRGGACLVRAGTPAAVPGRAPDTRMVRR